MSKSLTLRIEKKPAKVFFERSYVDGRYITTCTVLYGADVYSGSSICHPNDILDRPLGEKLAFKRAVEDYMARNFIWETDERQYVSHAWRLALRIKTNPELVEVKFEEPAPEAEA